MSNLDDFFKKRDKKKKGTSSKAKFSTLDTEKLAKDLETITVSAAPVEDEVDLGVPVQPESVEVVAVPVTRNVAAAGDNVDEEWKPFDSEENRDYTGLRINTNTWKDEEEDGDYDNVTDENNIKTSCPWGASGKPKDLNDEDADDEEQVEVAVPKTIAAILVENTNAANLAQPEAVAAATNPNAYIPPSMRARMAAEATGAKPVEVKPTPAAAPSGGSAYVPPSMRGRMGEGLSSSSGSGAYEISTSSVNYRRPNKSQPNFNDCLEFPSLDANAETQTADNMVNGNGGERFELVKKSARVEPKNEKDNQVYTQNKFGALMGNQQSVIRVWIQKI